MLKQRALLSSSHASCMMVCMCCTLRHATLKTCEPNVKPTSWSVSISGKCCTWWQQHGMESCFGRIINLLFWTLLGVLCVATFVPILFVCLTKGPSTRWKSYFLGQTIVTRPWWLLGWRLCLPCHKGFSTSSLGKLGFHWSMFSKILTFYSDFDQWCNLEVA